MSEKTLTPWTVLRDGSQLIWRFIKMHPVAFSIAVFGAAMFAGAIIASALIIGWITDNVILPVLDEGEEPDLLMIAAAGIVAVSVFKAVGIVLRRTSAGWLSFATRQDLRNELLAHQLSLKMSWFNRQAIGDLLAVADSDVNQGTGVLGPLPYAIGVSMLLLGTITMISIIDPWLGAATVIGLVVMIAIDVHGSWVTYGIWEEVQRRIGKVSSIAHESFDGALTVKSLGTERYVSSRFRRASEALRDSTIEVNSTWTKYQVIIRALPQLLIVLLLIVGAARIDAGAITAGNVVTVAYLLSLLAFPIQLIGFVLWDLSGSLAGWQRVQAIFAADDHIEYGEELATTGGPAQVRGVAVDFAYDREPVLSGLDLNIKAGTTLAVVGATASGKSTLCLLLARLFDPDSGRISLDGRDLHTFAGSELPKEVSYVAQNTFLFDTTVRANITLDEPFSEDEVATAVRLAGAVSFIEELPAGLDTELGERGTTLSGGQRQRLALARALIRKPRLMLLDDATSAVDPSVEAEILKALKSEELPSTIVVVAYRPSSIRLADEVVFLDEKRIVAHGPHIQLLDESPAYANLVSAYEEEARRLREEAS